ncbi:MAG: large subunit ribosomal protein L29 [Flavobacteriales bacterium]|jgi:large subunit ribosomal protein L29|tara:strand:- start:15563 stop:15763 length:201 start_codon:yes stop_codon:yes gene_type:complete
MKNKEIVELADKDLTQELKDKRVFLNKLKLNHKVSDIENPMIIRSTRRTIARIKTELTNRKTSTAK